ncbi:tetratricopeptide repeat protein [Sulfurimonas lithotrophica]|uniref:Tetratricopeptide repeat protein n=1 Tax=Sulfurimonas lithotrophica TaxID=2590022 RepID=A0A5P8NZX7_9BACT|nr:tetratricopeptide repeat protein [Sulfurimonas lithotrophica]QFR49003.1 tetratricopeptide repeat protein [Sulfurimonas lithotrophica]
MKDRLLVLFLTSFLFNFVLYADEPSAFGAGDLNNPSPYGLTQEEEILLQNKKNLKKITVKSNDQSNELESLRDRIDGLQGIIESLSRKAHKNNLELKNLDQQNNERLISSSEFEKRLLEVSTSNAELIKKNEAEIKSLKLIISELSALIDNINKNYVSKDEFNSLVNDVNSFKQLVAKELKGSMQKQASSYSSKSNAEVAKEAREHYDKKRYTEAIDMYTYLIEKNYKPARAHYMIGEMKYYRKDYSEAIAYFKKSAKLYSKANYMPTLMLHTAFSMKYNNDNKNAKSFFEAIVKKYPNTKFSDEANKQLELMK